MPSSIQIALPRFKRVALPDLFDDSFGMLARFLPRKFFRSWSGLVQLAALLATASTPAATAPSPNREYVIDAWGTDEGLPQNSVLSIAQTGDGYLWLATFQGLARFDGVRFTVFDAGNTPELRSSRITRLFRDRQDALWIVSEFGDLARLSHGSFTAYSAREGLPENGVASLVEDSTGALWASARRQPECYRLENGRFIRRAEGGSISTSGYGNLASTPDGAVWGNQRGNLVRILPEPSTIFILDPSAGVQWLAQARDGSMWATTHADMRRLRGGVWEPPLRWPMQVEGFGSIVEDSKSNLWVATWSHGLLRFDANRNLSQIKLTSAATPESVRSAFEDQEHNLWVGTDGLGLFRLKPRTIQTLGIADGLENQNVKSVAEDHDGTIWALNPSLVIGFPHGQAPGSATDWKFSGLWCAIADRQQGLWLGSYGQGVIRIEDGQARQLAFPDQRRNLVVSALLQDHAGVVWAGGEDGLWRIEDSRMKSVLGDPLPKIVDVRALAEDSQGRLYLGLNGGGLLRLVNGNFRQFSQKDGLIDNRVWALYIDPTDGVWMGSPGRGLSYLKNDQAFNFSDSSLALPRVIASIVEDDSGHLWLGSNKGLFRVSRSQLEEVAAKKRSQIDLFTYSKADGLATTEFTDGLHPAAIRGHDGRLWFATVNGLSVVDPKNIPVNSRPPPLVIEEVLIDDRWQSSNGSARPAPLTIPPGGHRLEIHYSGLSFTAAEKVRFKYRLRGLDPDWVDARTRRVAYYTRVPPGHYDFDVMACNNDGVWSQSSASLALEALPFFWQTNWFLAAASILAVTSVAAFARYISVQKLQRNLAALKQEHAVEIERARISRDMHDDVGASLTQLSLLGELARGELAPRDPVQKRLDEITALSREVVSRFDELVWAASPKHDPASSAVEYISQFAADFLQSSGFRCRLDLPDQLPSTNLSSTTRHHLFLVAKEALNNAVKYSGAEEIWLRVREENGKLTLTIEDRGRGFETDRGRRLGHGLENMRTRMEACGGSLVIESAPTRGTTVKISIPL